MKKIEKLSLNRLSKKELPLGEMNKVRGGTYTVCGCGCCYGGEPGDPGWGGSSTEANAHANCFIPTNTYDPETCPHSGSDNCDI